MGFLKTNAQLETMMNRLKTNWSYMSDSQYKEVVANWENKFEEKAKVTRYDPQGDDALTKVSEKLPIFGFIFNLPNYKHLPVTPSGHDPAYGYAFENLQNIDREILNVAEAIICDENYKFTCVFNHEGQALILEIYLEQ